MMVWWCYVKRVLGKLPKKEVKLTFYAVTSHAVVDEMSTKVNQLKSRNEALNLIYFLAHFVHYSVRYAKTLTPLFSGKKRKIEFTFWPVSHTVADEMSQKVYQIQGLVKAFLLINF
jgi:hypothetical protein